MCQQGDDIFLSTKLRILGLHCDDTGLYIFFLCLYFGLILGNHKLSTTIHQKHREALSELPGPKRNICCLAALNVAHSFMHIAFILFISSNNLGFLIVSVVAHYLGTIIVYKTQRPDHKHPLRALANALRHSDKNDADTQKDLKYILSRLRASPLKL